MRDQASQTIAEWRRMTQHRQMFMTQWDSVARYCCPRKGNILTKFSPGSPQTADLYDTTAEQSGGVFAAGCVTNICPAGEKWLRLEPKGKNAPASVTEWFDRCTDAVMDSIYNSNFYENIHEDFFDAGHFGTSCLLVDEDPVELFNFVNIPVGSFAIEENCRGQVDVVCREWKWTARQAEQKWGKEKLGAQERKALEDDDPNAAFREFTYLHMVAPRANSGYEGGAAIGTKRPYKSIYVCIEDIHVIEESGYYSMPYLVNRLLRSNQEVYGRGPGIQLLPDIRIANTMVRDYLIALEKLANPGWLLGDDQTAELDNRPNGKSYWDTTNPAGKPEQLQAKNRVDYLKEMIDEQRNVIRAGYFVPMFQMLSNEEERRRQKTATEVEIMDQEKMVLFSPLFGRITREKLNPLVARVFDIMARASETAWKQQVDGLLPLPPPEMKEFGQYNVVYVSKIALAVKNAENKTMAAILGIIEQAAQLDPSALDIIDIPESIRRIARNLGTPSALIRSKRDAEARGSARAEQQQQAAAPQQSEMATRAVKNLGPEAQTAAARAVTQAGSQKAA